MTVQLSQLGGIAEDHFEQTEDASYVKVEELHRNGDVGVVGGKYREKTFSLWNFFIINISMEDGSLLSKKILSSDEYETQIENLTVPTSQNTKRTDSSNNFDSHSQDIGFKVQSAITQGIMGLSIAMILALIMVGDVQGYGTVALASYLGLALAGYYDMNVVEEYGLWKPFKPAWTIGLFIPGINFFIGLIYMIRRWSIAS